MNREELIAAMTATADAKPRAVKVPKWGTVYVRDVTVEEAEAHADDTKDGKDKNRIARGAARVLCDESGKRLFDPDSDADVALLAKQPWPLLRKVLQDDDSPN